MIVPMVKAYVAARLSDRQCLLEALADLGLVHLSPVDPGKNLTDEAVASDLLRADRAIQVLSSITPAGEKTDLPADQVVRQVLDIQHKSAEHQGELNTLHHQLSQLGLWGDLKLQQLDVLKKAGLDVKFFIMPADMIDQVRADLCQSLRPLEGKRLLVAVVLKNKEAFIPEHVQELPIPSVDAPTIRAKARQIDQALEHDKAKLAQLAYLLGELKEYRRQLAWKMQLNQASLGGLEQKDLFAVGGYIPRDLTGELRQGLADRQIESAVEFADLAETEDPPTLVRPPRWARPIMALFEILGTVPGYREYDLAGFFMIALPVFAAMLIGDGGYGIIFSLLCIALYPRLAKKAGPARAQLLIIFSLTILLWGVLTANFFGITPSEIQRAGGFESIEQMRSGSGLWALMGRLMLAPAIFWHSDPQISRNITIKVCFTLGAIHLVSAHLRQILGLIPNLRFLAELGWVMVLGGMYGVVWMLFFPNEIWMPQNVMLGLLAGGWGLALLFSHPSRNPLIRVGKGLVTNILPLIGTFSDTMSYVRLMAVGLASYYIASAFNSIGYQVGSASKLLWPVAAAIIVAAHLLNITLSIIAVFAHGVRLNMLEFSSNAGVQWSGYPYTPFTADKNQGED